MIKLYICIVELREGFKIKPPSPQINDKPFKHLTK